MTEPAPRRRTALLALNDADALLRRGLIEDRGDYPTVLTLEAHQLGTLRADWATERVEVTYLTTNYRKGDRGYPGLIDLVRSASPGAEVRELDESGWWSGWLDRRRPQTAPQRAVTAEQVAADLEEPTDTRKVVGVNRPPIPTVTRQWLYLRGHGWLDGPWTVDPNTGEATHADDEGATAILLADVSGWSDVPLEHPHHLPGRTHRS